MSETQQQGQTLENYKVVINNMRAEINELQLLKVERERWSRERANTYLELGEIERILFSDDTPSKKVLACKRVIKSLNDPEFLQRFLG